MDIIGKKWYFFIFSGIIIIPGIVSLILWGISPSIDFTGGTLLELRVVQSSENLLGDKSAEPEVSKEKISQVVKSQDIEIASISQSGENTYLLRLKPIDQKQNTALQEKLKQELGDMEELRYETVGPTIGKETTENAVKAVIFASVAIISYIALAFRKIPSPYSSVKFGVAAVFALLHDTILVLGIFSMLGHFLSIEVDPLFITAILTIMGFSVHDSIVVFDRIRENLSKMPKATFSEVVNESIISTLSRSLAISLTVIFTLSSLLIFGGESIRWFMVALLIGIVSGTYSSIFNAAPLLVLWEERRKK